MFVIRPVYFTDTTFVSSTVPESEAVYSSGTTYASGAIVRGNTSDTAHIAYESLAGSNMGNALTDATKWLVTGNTNRWKALNRSVSQQTEFTDSAEYVVTSTGRIDTVAVHNVSAASIRVVKTNPIEGVVFDETRSLISTSGINNLFKWLFEPVVRIKDTVIEGLGVHAGCEIAVTLTDTGNTGLWGVLDVGQMKRVGHSQYGATVGIRDFSDTEQDNFGDLAPVERVYAKRARFTDWFDSDDVDQIQNLLASYRAKPLTCVGSPVYGATILMALINFDIEIAGPNHSLCSMEIKGVT